MTKKNIRLGKFLQKCRSALGIGSQQAAAIEITKRGQEEGIKVSQALVAQYETGRVVDPNPDVLRMMAAVYGIDYLELLYHLDLDKHNLDADWAKNDLLTESWEVVKSLTARHKKIGEVEGLGHYQLRAIAQLMQEAEILDLDGLAEWRMKLTPLTEYWVISPNFVDDQSDKIMDAVAYDLKRNAELYYYVLRNDTAKYGRFWDFVRKLETRYPKLIDKIQKQIHVVPIDDDDQKWLNTDIGIANPKSEKPIGFSSIRLHGMPVYGVRMATSEVAKIVARLSDYQTEVLGANVETSSRFQKA